MLVGRFSPRGSSAGITPFVGRLGQCEYFCTTPAGGHLARLHSGSSVESGFEAGTLRPRGSDFTTRSPCKSGHFGTIRKISCFNQRNLLLS
ncbi:hypothetical protein AVEN_177042-1 [Araneus ventricosus]|uniref:Uncharacterized protein n=1 Tax=Araneus ventricosus TaxID=182803 RepID=A0A4Y2CTQ4_ARAVE|nr:hypothetical protein AVEN_177042-1 [Araneus ventricosus]